MSLRLFYAFMPSAAEAGATLVAADQIRANNPSGRWRPTLPARLHMTAQFLGTFDHGVPDDVERAAVAAGASIVHSAFVAQLDRVDAFRGRHGDVPIVMLSDQECPAIGLNAALRGAMAGAGIGAYAKGPFTPHVTIAYGAPIAAVALAEPIAWRIRELHLLKSRDKAPEFEVVARWVLAAT